MESVFERTAQLRDPQLSVCECPVTNGLLHDWVSGHAAGPLYPVGRVTA